MDETSSEYDENLHDAGRGSGLGVGARSSIYEVDANGYEFEDTQRCPQMENED